MKAFQCSRKYTNITEAFKKAFSGYLQVYARYPLSQASSLPVTEEAFAQCMAEAEKTMLAFEESDSLDERLLAANSALFIEMCLSRQVSVRGFAVLNEYGRLQLELEYEIHALHPELSSPHMISVEQHDTILSLNQTLWHPKRTQTLTPLSGSHSHPEYPISMPARPFEWDSAPGTIRKVTPRELTKWRSNPSDLQRVLGFIADVDGRREVFRAWSILMLGTERGVIVYAQFAGDDEALAFSVTDFLEMVEHAEWSVNAYGRNHVVLQFDTQLFCSGSDLYP
ncbi:hypothetical protein D9757_010865 [Collybiopsis confluens]|uniref:Uncharacterized protein n=1 Tax=Collybiopsis confluens TaxID=2823264 RepID=A0A8H5H838_9AGAR|nr:hypothetical protein D9757_010865 [Collybiopsis confluens]